MVLLSNDDCITQIFMTLGQKPKGWFGAFKKKELVALNRHVF